MLPVQKLLLLLTGLMLAFSGLSSPAGAEEPDRPQRPTRNLFGVTGLIDMPTAEMQPDGEVALSGGHFGTTLRTTLTVQFLPWLELAFRYTKITDWPSSRGEVFDRSFDAKLRLIEETETWPAISLGLQDFLGTGIYSGEYLAATKGFGAGELGEFRVTGGLGWGRFAGKNTIRNPLCSAPGSDRFCERKRGPGKGGTVNFGRFFGGEDLGFFGGIEWITPVEGLTAKVEYSPDAYLREQQQGAFKQKNPINMGLDYQLNDGVEIGAYYMYGSEVGIRVSLSGNPFRPLSELDLETPAKPLKPREGPDKGVLRQAFGAISSIFDSEPSTATLEDARLRDVVVHERLGNVRWAEAIVNKRAGEICPHDLARAIDAAYGLVDVVTFSRPGDGTLCTVALRPAGEDAVRLTARSFADYPTDWFDEPDMREDIATRLAEELEPSGIRLFGIEIAPERVQVYIENKRFHETPRAFGRTARALSEVMPPSVETFAITPVDGALPVSTITLQRSSLEDQVARPHADRRTWATAEIEDATPVRWSSVLSEGVFPRYNWTIQPAVPVSLFDPDAPIRFDVVMKGAASIEFWPGLSATAAVSKRLFGQLDEITRPSDSVLPHVRSDFARYLRDGDPALNQLTGDYLTKLAPSFYGRISAGLLERMYGGVSGEVLWKPASQSWGLGLEMNYVKKRDYDSLFSFRDYEVATGHASVYWDTDFHGLSFQLDAGRYLAGDWGGTFTLKRRFDNGWEIGAFATLTDVPFDDFGEGSFDKGIFLRIPLNWALPYESRSAFSTTLRPLTRDGGQRLSVGNRLYGFVQDQDRRGYRRNWQAFWQ